MSHRSQSQAPSRRRDHQRAKLAHSNLASLLTQILLLAPSLVLSLIGLVSLSTRQYALWALVFSLGSAAIIVDGGASTLAQVYRAEGVVSSRELLRLFGLASLAPCGLTLVMLGLWGPIQNLAAGPPAMSELWFPLVLGLGTTVRSWQNVANGVAMASEARRTRLSVAALAVVVQVTMLGVFAPRISLLDLAIVYSIGATIGVIGLTPVLIRSLGRPPARGHDALLTRGALAMIGVVVTQGDRVVVGAVSSAGGLAAYDVAARLVSTTAVICLIVSYGLAAEGSRWALKGRVLPIRQVIHRAQRLVDVISVVMFASLPFAAAAITLYTKPELAKPAVVATCILGVGYAVNATTAPITNFLSGARILRPETLYLGGVFAITVICVPPLAIWLGMPGAAAGFSLAALVPSAWLRIMGQRYAGSPMAPHS